ARWWDHLAPQLASGRRVVALDISGHGDSDHRATYEIDQWADEVLAVAAAADLGPRPIIIGHSLGGLLTMHVTRCASSTLGGAMVIDSPIGTSPAHSVASEQMIFPQQRAYPSAQAAIERFRPVPAQPMLPYIAEHIAGHSVREVAAGWTWKFDMGLFP